MKKIDSLSSAQKAKLAVAEKMYYMYNFLQNTQSKTNRAFGKKKQSVAPLMPGESTAMRPRKVKTTSWADVMKGVDVLTTKGMPMHHFPDTLSAMKATLPLMFFPMGYSLKHRFTKEGFKKLAETSSPFYRLSYKDTWVNDEEFAFRFVQGPLPNHIRKCKAEDRVFRNLPEQMESELGMNKENLIDHCYVVDFSIFDKLPTKEDYFMGAPQVLFFQKGNELLKPIAISISPEDEKIYTPKDSKEAWIFAKLTALNAEVVYMPIITHVVNGHFWMDPIIIATDTTLPANHPVYQLLYPHFKGNIAINKFAYELLLKPKGFFDQISVFKYEQIHEVVVRGLKEFKFSDRIIPENFAERQIADIAYYPYRDDAAMLWDAVQEYVKNYLNVFYKTEADMSVDNELARWRAMVNRELALDPSISITSLLAATLYNVFEHNIQQNSILEYFMDPYNNGPLKTQLPKRKEEITEDFLYDSISDIKGLICRGMLIRVITEQTDRVAPLQSQNSKVNEVNDLFSKRLEDIEAKLVKANRTRLKPYTSAYPSKIDNSIKI